MDVDAVRLGRLERQVAYLFRQLNLDPAEADRFATDHLPPEFGAAVRAGNLIQAIKIYREATGAGLAEAKTAVERIARGG